MAPRHWGETNLALTVNRLRLAQNIFTSASDHFQTFFTPFLPYNALISVFAFQMVLRGFLPKFLYFASPVHSFPSSQGNRHDHLRT